MESSTLDQRQKFGRVAVLCGGESRERPISIRSGKAVYQALARMGLDVVKVDTANGFHSVLRKQPIDLAFLALHGQGGEDGSIQKILERHKIRYSGSNPASSARAFNKARAKSVFQRAGIPTPHYDQINRRNWRSIMARWSTPFVLKPICEGSSIDVYIVKKPASGLRIVRLMLRRYDRVMIEEKIEGREFTVGILGERALPVIELRPKREFYDYRAKYTKGLTDYLIPAPISKSLAAALKRLALKAHRALGLMDLSRVDIMLDCLNRPFVLEVNSIPGFTETSLLPKAARSVGLSFDALCLKLLERARRKRA